MRRLQITQLLALITSACFIFAAVVFINSGSQPWWVHSLLLVGAACMALFVIRTSRHPDPHT